MIAVTFKIEEDAIVKCAYKESECKEGGRNGSR